MDYKIEVIVVPVTDIDRAKAFYSEQLGFNVDVDDSPTPDVRIVQLTPPGSGCSVTIGKGMGVDMVPGTLKGVQICVADIDAAHAELSGRGVPTSPIRHVGPNGWEDGKGGDWNAFFFFDDPDGNGWAVQESPTLRAQAAAG
jgi:catechol 2,3-dioxygenase-like lactoylglutathione lyase family enzyme